MSTNPNKTMGADATVELVLRWRGVDQNVALAACQMDAVQKGQPAWLWYENGLMCLSFSRWRAAPTQAPYIRADIAADVIAGLQAEVDRLTLVKNEMHAAYFEDVGATRSAGTENAKLRPLDLANLLRHAFDEGATGKAWEDYDCTALRAYHSVAEACGIPAEYYAGSKPVEDAEATATRTIGVDLAAGPDETVNIVVMTQDEYEQLTKPVDLPPGAHDALANNQRQLDVDGCEVGVSRQALDEMLASWRSLKAHEERQSARIAELSETWTDRHGTVWNPPTAWAYARACLTRDRRIDESDSLRAELEELKDSVSWWEERAVAAEGREPNLMAALRCALHYLAEHQLSVKEVQSIVANHPTVLQALGKGSE